MESADWTELWNRITVRLLISIGLQMFMCPLDLYICRPLEYLCVPWTGKGHINDWQSTERD